MVMYEAMPNLFALLCDILQETDARTPGVYPEFLDGGPKRAIDNSDRAKGLV